MLALLSLTLLAGCAHVRPARLALEEDERPEEKQARETVAASGCPAAVPLLFPGIAEACLGRPAEGAALASLGAAELATGVAVAAKNGLTHPGAAVPLTAFQDLWIASASEWALEHQRAARARFVPPERLLELTAAPFSPEVVRLPEVWLGLVGMVAADLLVTRLLAGPAAFDFSLAGQPPNLFGTAFQPLPGGALAGAVGVSLFTHVAIAEEAFFRGYVQSSLARALGETPGWLWGSALFGATHSLNALFLPDSERLIYLAVYVPFITLLGGYLGFVYRHNGYSLAPPVALHFWYDLAVSALGYAQDPQHNPLSATVSFGW
ncbi:MAG TPA: CPBP family intramembrane glutamic endopeptidase [Myxococcales bacterium]|nr:CPBP family intramembrane glutamic endopeptidase [Myxococcales bacterium]